MKLKKIIKEEMDDLQWIRDIPDTPLTMPAKYLQPNDKFMITKIWGRSFMEYMEDGDLKEHDPFKTIFSLSDNQNFNDLNSRLDYTDTYVEAEEVDIWIHPDGETIGGWVFVDEIEVMKL